MTEKLKNIMQGKDWGKGFLLALISVMAFEMNFEVTVCDEAGGVLYEVLASLNGWGIEKAVLVICLSCFYVYVKKHYPFQKSTAILSFCLSVFVLIGLCYVNATGLALTILRKSQMIKTLIVLFGYGVLFYCGIVVLEIWLRGFLLRQAEETRDSIVKYSLKAGIFILVCWLPYLICFYPGTTLYDAGTMLGEYFGFYPVTNHHPYFQTLLMGWFVDAGNRLGSGAAGMFVYVLIQVLMFIAVIAYMLGEFYRLGISRRTRRILMFLYAFLPVFPLYAISVGKNINFAIVVMLLTIFMFEIIESEDSFVKNKVKMALLPILLVLICLFRNEGLAIVIACFPCFLLMARKKWKAFTIIFVDALIIVAIWFKAVLPLAGVADGSVAESLSIPFVQTARCVYYYGDEMPEEEKEVIDKILVFDTLAQRYKPESSDRVKEQYNEDATKEDIQAYIRVYMKQFLEHPITYVDAFLNKCYGYFYPDDKGRAKFWFVVGADVAILNEAGFDLYSPFQSLVKGMDHLMTAFRDIPLFGMTSSAGFYTWCALLAAFFIGRCGKKKYLYLFVPSLVVLLVCVASPINAYFRYELPIVFLIPFFIGVTACLWKRQDTGIVG